MHVAVAERVVKYGNTVFFENSTYFCEQEPDDDMAAFYTRFTFVAKKIAKSGIIGDFDSIIQPVQYFAKCLLQYKKEAKYNPVFVEKCLELLEINEMHYYLETLKKEWPFLEFSSKVMQDVEDRYFESRSYLPLKQLKYITEIYCAFNKYLKTLDEKNISLLERAVCIRKVGYLYLRTVEVANVENHLELYKELDASIQTVLNKLIPNSPVQVFLEHTRIIIYSRDCDTADDEIDEDVQILAFVGCMKRPPLVSARRAHGVRGIRRLVGLRNIEW